MRRLAVEILVAIRYSAASVIPTVLQRAKVIRPACLSSRSTAVSLSLCLCLCLSVCVSVLPWRHQCFMARACVRVSQLSRHASRASGSRDKLPTSGNEPNKATQAKATLLPPWTGGRGRACWG